MMRTTKFNYYLKSMSELGFSKQEVLEGTHLEPEHFEESDYLADPWQSDKLITNMLELTGNEALAFELTKNFDLADFGIVGYAMMSSKSGREAIKLWISYSHYLVGSLIDVALEETDSYWKLRFTETSTIDKAAVFCTEEVLLHILSLGEKLLGASLHCQSLHLSYDAPAHHKLYKKIFKCPVAFGAEKTELAVSRPSLDSEIKTNNRELYNICLVHCDQVLRQITRHSSTATRIRTLLLENTGRIPPLKEVADTLNMSPTSLKRHLLEEGLSYKKLVNEFRNDLAKQYLSNSPMSTKEIAFVLGYEDVGAFRRAFKAWNGVTVGGFQKEN